MTQKNMMNADNYINTQKLSEKATEIEVGLLLNFGKKPEFKRKVFSNKKNLI